MLLYAQPQQQRTQPSAFPLQRIVLVTCQPDQLRPMLDDFTDRLALLDGASILYYGTTNKAHLGYLLLRFTKPDGLSTFLTHAHASEDILDVVVYTPNFVEG